MKMTELEKYKEGLRMDISEYLYSDKELEELKQGRPNTYIHTKAQNDAYKLVLMLIDNKVY